MQEEPPPPLDVGCWALKTTCDSYLHRLTFHRLFMFFLFFILAVSLCNIDRLAFTMETRCFL